MTAQRDDLRRLVDRLSELAARRLALGPTGGAATRAVQLRDHVAGHLRVRAASLDAPLLVLLLGPTGAGKSSLFNAIAGRAASASGVLRPTTRTALVLANGGDLEAVRSGALEGFASGALSFAEDPLLPSGVALVDAPDVDSIEHANRALADQLVEAADLCLFVTTATRYADQVPWSVLGRVRERGLPLVVVVNRLPTDEPDRSTVLDDVGRLFRDAGFGADLEITGVAEGALDPDRDALDAAAVGPIRARIEALRGDADARRRLAAEALAGSLAGAGPLVERVADDVAHEQIDVAALRRIAATDHRARARRPPLRARPRHVPPNGGPPPLAALRRGGRHHPPLLEGDRGASAGRWPRCSGRARRRSSRSARRPRTIWSRSSASMPPRRRAGRPRRGPTSRGSRRWWPSGRTCGPCRPGSTSGCGSGSSDWIASIGEDIAATGEGKRRLARGASVGVNAIGTGVMLATFIHTAGLTGAEVGVAAATAFLNQKLLGALFGEAAMVELIGRARKRLDAALDETFAEEAARYEAIVPTTDDLEELAAELRRVASDIRGLGAPVAALSGSAVSGGDAPG